MEAGASEGRRCEPAMVDAIRRRRSRCSGRAGQRRQSGYPYRRGTVPAGASGSAAGAGRLRADARRWCLGRPGAHPDRSRPRDGRQQCPGAGRELGARHLGPRAALGRGRRGCRAGERGRSCRGTPEHPGRAGAGLLAVAHHRRAKGPVRAYDTGIPQGTCTYAQPVRCRCCHSCRRGLGRGAAAVEQRAGDRPRRAAHAARARDCDPDGPRAGRAVDRGAAFRCPRPYAARGAGRSAVATARAAARHRGGRAPRRRGQRPHRRGAVGILSEPGVECQRGLRQRKLLAVDRCT